MMDQARSNIFVNVTGESERRHSSPQILRKPSSPAISFAAPFFHDDHELGNKKISPGFPRRLLGKKNIVDVPKSTPEKKLSPNVGKKVLDRISPSQGSPKNYQPLTNLMVEIRE